MSTFRSRLSLVPWLMLWAVCSVSQVQAEVKAVKLCGREFIRAVVYTCGGSRWRRFLFPQNMDGFSTGDQSSTEAEGLSESAGTDLSTRDLNHMVTNMCCQSVKLLGWESEHPKYQATVLSWKREGCSLQVREQKPPLVEEIKYLGILFTSDGTRDWQTDGFSGSNFYWSVVVKQDSLTEK